jgi:hypothetical protein
MPRIFAPKSVQRLGGSGLEYRSAVPAQFGWANSLRMSYWGVFD